jgi:hypothetical protein
MVIRASSLPGVRRARRHLNRKRQRSPPGWHSARDHRGAVCNQGAADGAQRIAHRPVVGQQIERRPGQEHRPVWPPRVQRLHRGDPPTGVHAPFGRPAVQPGDHVRRGIDTVQVQAHGAEVEQRITVSAPELQGRLTEPADQLAVRRGREAGRFERRVQLGDEPRVERADEHVRQ